ncbi:MAG: hypothetical protein IT537_30600 [Hyphomicrobiales bacterium]|nr:hypothetical protein [Hyphomicrobiales bacterium]
MPDLPPALSYLEWLVYRDGGELFVIIQPAASLIHARLHAALSDLDGGGRYIEGHELDAKTARKVPKSAIGKRLTQAEAAKLLAKIGG